MPIPLLVKTLTTKYAHLRGEYEYADRDIEGVIGLDAIDAATARILKRKKQIHRQMNAIEIVIHLFDPTWDFATVKPIRPSKSTHKKGSVAQFGYDVLRENNNEPMTIWKMVRPLVAKLGITNPDTQVLQRYAANLNTTFMNRRHDTVKMLEGLPRRWMLRNYVPLPSADASSSSRSKPEKPDALPRRAKAG
jgi:hypothetical protein